MVIMLATVHRHTHAPSASNPCHGITFNRRRTTAPPRTLITTYFLNTQSETLSAWLTYTRTAPPTTAALRSNRVDCKVKGR